MILIVAVVSWSISAVGNFAFCSCTSACLHASPTNQACSAHLWNSGNLMRLGGWGDGEEFVWPALTCGLFVLKWCLPNVTCCCPGTEECGICTYQQKFLQYWCFQAVSETRSYKSAGCGDLLETSGPFMEFAWVHQWCQITWLLKLTTLKVSSLMGTLLNQTRLFPPSWA